MKPVIRTITGFISAGDSAGLHELVEMVLVAREAYRSSGYEVQTIRITTDILEQGDGLAAMARYRDFLAGLENDENVSFYHLGSIDQERALDPEAEAELVDLFIEYGKSFLAVDAGSGAASKPLCLTGARLCKAIAERSPFECRRFGVYAGVRSSTPFYPASKVLSNSMMFAVGSQCANLAVEEAVRSGEDLVALEANLRERMDKEFEMIAAAVPPRLAGSFLGCDTSLAPFPADPMSIANAIEKALGKPFGSSGTLSVCRMLTRIMQSVAVLRTGLCGLMLPVVEDSVLARRGIEGRYTWKELLLYSSVCATGLDTVPISGRTSVEDLAGGYHDLATLAVSLGKPLSARFFVEPDRLPGQTVKYDWEFACESPVFEI